MTIDYVALLIALCALGFFIGDAFARWRVRNNRCWWQKPPYNLRRNELFK